MRNVYTNRVRQALGVGHVIYPKAEFSLVLVPNMWPKDKGEGCLAQITTVSVLKKEFDLIDTCP